MNERIFRTVQLLVAITLPCQLLPQAVGLRTIAKEMRAQRSGLRKLVTPKIVFSRPKSNIASLDGLDEIPDIESAVVVNLPGNKIETIPAGFFKNPKFKNVRWLNLSGNKIRDIEEGGLEGLENLWFLFLGHNQMRAFKPETLKVLKSLKVLTLDGNLNEMALAQQARQQLPGTLITTKKLTQNFMKWTLRVATAAAVIATGAGLVIVAKRAGQAQPISTEPQAPARPGPQEPVSEPIEGPTGRSVEDLLREGPIRIQNGRLNLSQKGLVSLKGLERIEDPEMVTALDLSLNMLSDLPEDVLDRFVNLQDLNLFGNALRTLPVGVFKKIKRLRMLYLSSNRLANLLPGLLENLVELTGLYLSSNEFSELEVGTFSRLKNLRELDLSYNKLSTLGEGLFEDLGNLHELILSHNLTLNTLPPQGAWRGLTSLTVLGLSSTGLSEQEKERIKDYFEIQLRRLNPSEPGSPRFIVHFKII